MIRDTHITSFQDFDFDNFIHESSSDVRVNCRRIVVNIILKEKHNYLNG